MTQIHTTIRPADVLNVDDAELESLTRQGLVVGVSAPPGPARRPDPVVAYVSTTLNPAVLLGVDDAELESLTRQGLVAHVFPRNGSAFSAVASGAGAARSPAVSSAVTAGVAVGTGSALALSGGYGVGGYGVGGYGI